MIKFSKITLFSIFLVVFIIIAGFFAYQWWQVKEELVKQIEENENLVKQVDELQKEIEGLKSDQVMKDKTIKDKKEEVTITTDKAEYEQGENIKITAINGLDKSIWYEDGPVPPLTFWILEKFENNQWKNKNLEGFQLPVVEEGKEVCYIFLFERPDLAELETNSEISHEWNQKICVFDDKEEPFEPTFIGSGLYRFTFTYGLSRTNYELVDKKTVHSNEFVIKED